MRFLIDGEPCGHPGCLSHVSHPCEGCGRISGRSSVYDKIAMALYDHNRPMNINSLSRETGLSLSETYDAIKKLQDEEVVQTYLLEDRTMVMFTFRYLSHMFSGSW